VTYVPERTNRRRKTLAVERAADDSVPDLLELELAEVAKRIHTATLRARGCQRVGELLRYRRLQIDPFTGDRMDECESRRVQELPPQPELVRPAVDRISGHRQVDRREVHADLMRAPRLETHVEQRVPR